MVVIFTKKCSTSGHHEQVAQNAQLDQLAESIALGAIK